MDIQRAKELLTVLADGIDPLTGEVLPDDHVCNKGEIVRALNCAVEVLSRRKKKPLPENNGKPWTEELLITQPTPRSSRYFTRAGASASLPSAGVMATSSDSLGVI